MQNLDDSSLIEIFSYLNKKDIKSVTRVCSRWFNLVNTSGKIMEKLQLVLSSTRRGFKDSVNLLLNSNRKYKKVKIENFGRYSSDLITLFDLQHLLAKLGKTIEELEIISCYFTSSEIELLDHFSKIKKINIVFPSEIFFPKGRNNNGLLQWLVKQENLKELQIQDYDYVTCIYLFNEDISGNVKFQLETLVFRKIAIHDQKQTENFEKFIITQKKLTNFAIVEKHWFKPKRALDHVCNLPTLNKLELNVDCRDTNLIESDAPNGNVKFLKIHYNGLSNDLSDGDTVWYLIMTKFPKVKNLEIKIITDSEPEFYHQRQTLRICWPKLEELCVSSEDLNEWSFDFGLKRLKSLEFRNCKIDNLTQPWQNLAKKCPKLTSLVFTECNCMPGVLKRILEVCKFNVFVMTDTAYKFSISDESVKNQQQFKKVSLYLENKADSKVFETLTNDDSTSSSMDEDSSTS